MMLFYSETKKTKYFLDPPPPKKANGYERSRYGYKHIVFAYTSSLWPGFLLGRD